MRLTSSVGFLGEDHKCKEAEYFQEHIEEYTKKESHEDKSLKTHVYEVLDAFNRAYRFYNFRNEILREIGHYLAYYHDLGKLDDSWNIRESKKPAHSPLSVNRICQENLGFKTRWELTPLILYLIYRHHSDLIPPEKMYAPNDYFFLIKNFMHEYWSNSRVHFPYLEPFDVADIFGLFKIADALSASNDGSQQFERIYRLLDKRPDFSENDVRSMIGKTLHQDRWRQQLRIKDLPYIGMLRAPTGWGKTTVSLLFSIGKDCNRIFYLLPTTTAINKFYNKLCRAFGGNVSKYFYFYDTEIKEDNEKLHTLYFVQNFVSPIVLTTVDQFLLSFLQCGKYFTKRISFRNSVLLFDEIHLLNPVMLEILSFFLKKYEQKYGLKPLIMSATFPQAYVEYFMRELDIPKSAFIDFGDEYRKRRRVMFNLYKQDILDGMKEIYDNYREGKRVLVVVNTVEKAVRLAKNLREKFCEKREQRDVVLLHARFMYKDRRQVEKKIDQLDNSRTPHILIATQVCEVSLDISYDLLYAELASLGALMQRFGRVNRYGKWTEKQNVNIYTPEELRDIDGKRRYPYEQWEIENSQQVLAKLRMDNLKDEKQLLDYFDEILSYEDLEEKIDKTGIRFNLKVWNSLVKDFYSLNLQEDSLRQLLHYRDSFNVLVIPSPYIINSESKEGKITQKTVERFIKKLEKRHKSSFTEKRRLIATAKEISVPVPIWWLKGKVVDSDRRAFPIVEFRDRIYDPLYGFIPYTDSTIL